MVRRYQHSVFAEQYDLSEGDGEHLGDVSWYLEALTDAPGRVLEIGAGTGRVTWPLVRDGIDVVALDIGAAMLQRLRTRADVPPACVTATAIALPIRSAPDAGLAAVISTYNTLGCLLARPQLARALGEAARVLSSGATLAFDVAIQRPDDHIAGPRRFEWERWTAPSGRVIERRTTLEFDRPSERLRLGYEYRWREPDGAEGQDEVTFEMNTWPLDDYLDAAGAAGFDIETVDRRTFDRDGLRIPMWAFVRARRR